MKNLNLTRREMLSLTGAGVLMPQAAFASVPIGDWTVHSLSDGSLRLPAGMVLDPLDDSQEASVREAFDLGDTLSPPCNVTLLQNGDRNVLVDVGAGPEFQATAGQLLDALDGTGLVPDDITDVIFTHAHPDHIWGLLDDFDDLTFWNATYQMGRSEWEYWTDPNTVDTIGEARTTFAVGAARRLERIADQVVLFEDGQEILPGVAARATFGHTPGHMAFEVKSGSESLMILGDCIANHHVALAHPGWNTGSDQDQSTGAATRLNLLDQITAEQTPVLGFHFPGDGLGQIEKWDGGYRFVPMT